MSSTLRLAIAFAMASTPLITQASETLAAKYACVACHQVDRKGVGPAWNEIGARYANGSKTAVQLAESIRKGGSGKWGPVPMPAQPAVTEADAKTLAEWALGHRK